MKLSKIKDAIDVEYVYFHDDCEILHGYTGDLLSMVMKNAKNDSIWITIQNHVNIVAVAAMVGVKAIVLCEGLEFSQEVIEKAKEEGINLLSSKENSFVVTGKIYSLGII